MKTKIEDLRNHLFATLEALQDEDKPMDLDRAKTIAEVAQVIVNTAKVECDYAKITGRVNASFIDAADALPAPGMPRLVKGKAQV